MSSDLEKDFLEADQWEMEQTLNDLNKILKGEIGAEEIEKKLKAKEERKKREKILEEIKQREKQEKLLNGNPGKGDGPNYYKFCPFCFYEYQIKDLDYCTHCKKELITREERIKILKQKVEILKEQKKRKKFRRMKYDNWIKSQGEIHILDAAKHGPTNYSKWDMYESESDEEDKQPILPRHDPNFIALEKSMNDDMKRREISQRKSLKFKEEGNKFIQEKKYKKAIECYTNAIEEVRSNMILYTNRAFAYMKLEEWKNACDDCDKVINYYEVFEDEINNHIDTYTKALTRKAFSLLQMKDYKEAKETIDKAIDYNKDSVEIKKLSEEIEHGLSLYKKSVKTMKDNKKNNNDNMTEITKLIEDLKKSFKNDKITDKKALADQFDIVIKIIENENKKVKENEENNYILFFSISGGIESLFNFLNSRANNDSLILTKLLTLLNLISDNDKYKLLVNSVKGYNKLIQFLFTSEANAKPEDAASDNKMKKKYADAANDNKHIGVSIDQANIILSILEGATLNDSCRKKITDISHLDQMSEIVLNKYELQKISDVKTANLLSKVYTFICNICYSSDEIRKKVSIKVSEIFIKQLNEFIDKYNIELEHHKNLLSSVLSFITNLANDVTFRTNISKEKKFLKFLSDNLLVTMINNELLLKGKEMDEIYEKTCSLFYNLTFINGEEKNIVDYYFEIHIEAFLFYFINHKFNKNKEYLFTYLLRTIMLLFRIVKYNQKIFDTESPIPEKESVLDNLIDIMNPKFTESHPDIIDYNIKAWVFLIKSDFKPMNEKGRMAKLIKNCSEMLRKDCGNEAKGVNEKNYQRIVNNLSLLIGIIGKYPDNAKEIKNIIPDIIIICKEKTELLRKNAAVLLAKFARSSEENEQYVRDLHGMEVLLSVSGFIK